MICESGYGCAYPKNNKMKVFISGLIWLISFWVQAQQYNVNLKTYKEDKSVSIYAYNNTSISHEVTLFLTTEGYRKHSNEITKMVEPKDSVLMAKLIGIPDKGQKMTTRYRFYPRATSAERKAKEKQLDKRAIGTNDDINTGIVIFDKSDCSRCENATSYLLDQGLEFKWIPLPTNDQVSTNDMPDYLRTNRKILIQKLQENGIFGTFTTPVIIVDGVLTHSHANLTQFLTTLTK